MYFMNKRIKICYIGGGSQNWAWVLMKDLTFEKELKGEIYLYDINFAAAQANETIGDQLMQEHNPGSWKFIAVPSLKEALDGADFIIISILPKDFKEMETDVHAPEKFGLYQSVGDTAGPGGLIRAMRALPMFREIAGAIRTYAPDAWVLNYTNPMSLCTGALYKEFPEIKALGCCHEVFDTQKLLAKVVEKAGFAEEGSVQREEIKTNVKGINHFTWIDKASYQGENLIPIYRKFCELHYESGYALREQNWLNNVFHSANRVKMDLFLKFGDIAAAGDRHLAEFCPSSWYLASPKKVESWKFSLTPVSLRIKMREELHELSAGYQNGTDIMKPENSGEEGIQIIKALLGFKQMVTNVNLPNKAQAPDLPNGTIVETNALIRRDSVQAVYSGNLKPDIRKLMLKHVSTYERMMKAIFSKDINLARNVFAAENRISELNQKDAFTLFDDMTIKTLPDYKDWY
jgi:galacturan 1,4-alpha-galacturonidase